MEMKYLNSIGFFSEMNLTAFDNGSIKEYIVDSVNYDKKKIVRYLQSFKHKASCPKQAIDCITGETISPSFLVYDDGDYCWADFLVYHIEKYNIKLNDDFIRHVYEQEDKPNDKV